MNTDCPAGEVKGTELAVADDWLEVFNTSSNPLTER